jgi:L-fuculose-phosphate aldolase
VSSAAVTLDRSRATAGRIAARWARRRVGGEVLGAARAMAHEGLVIGTVGNVSARSRPGFVITPTRLAYDRIRVHDLVVVALDGRVLAGRRAPSREWPMHARIYDARPDVRAVVHTHSMYATAWSFRPRAGALPALEEAAYYGVGAVAVAPHAAAGGRLLADAAAGALGAGRAALLGSHGVIAVGQTVEQALVAARVVERQAAIAWLLEGRNPSQPLI